MSRSEGYLMLEMKLGGLDLIMVKVSTAKNSSAVTAEP